MVHDLAYADIVLRRLESAIHCTERRAGQRSIFTLSAIIWRAGVLGFMVGNQNHGQRAVARIKSYRYGTLPRFGWRLSPLWRRSAVRARYRREQYKRRRDIVVKKGLHERAGWLKPKALNVRLGENPGAICGDGIA